MINLNGLHPISSLTILMVLWHLKSKTFLCLLDLKEFLERCVHRNTCAKLACPLHFGKSLKMMCQHGCSDRSQTKKNCRRWGLMIGMVPNLMVGNSSGVSLGLGHIGVGNMAILPARAMLALTTMKCVISSPANDQHRIVHSGSTPDFTGPMVSRGLPKVTGMSTLSRKRICVQ